MKVPVALSMISPHAASLLPARMKIGKLNAAAVSEEVFHQFGIRVHETLRVALANPIRLLSLSHMKNAVAHRIGALPESTIPLIEGYLYEEVKTGSLVRFGTVSASFANYHVYTGITSAALVETAINHLQRRVQERYEVTLESMGAVVPAELLDYPRNGRVLLGCLVYFGLAHSRVNDLGLSSICFPDACD